MATSTETPAVGPDTDEEGELLEKFRGWDKALQSHWGPWLEETRECFDFVAGRQWSETEEADMISVGKIPVTFNRTAPTIDAVSGAEITSRQQVSYEPRQVGASANTEVLNKGADWIRDECDAEHEESEAARDCFICGVGWMEWRMDYEEDPEGRIIGERRDPMDILADPNARKANFLDARYIRERKRYSQEEFDAEFPDASGDSNEPNKTPVVVDPDSRYKNGESDETGEDEVIVSRYQWYEPEPLYLVKHPETGQVHALKTDEFSALQQANQDQGGPPINHVKGKGRRYREAIVGAGRILDLKDIEVGEFTLKAMTGKRDRNKGVWYGLVRPMRDPQKFANKFFSQILNILNSNAKGGVMAEESAFKDPREAEDDWADYSKITWLQDGALSGANGPKIRDKTPPAYPQGQDRLMQVSTDAIRDVTGVNQEMLGLADRQQPGILEHQRKQAAYGILAAFFDSFRRYRKDSGRVLLKLMQKFLPRDYLVRIIGEDGSPAYQAIGTALQDDTIKFNVIVDDAPTGPNEKAKTWDMIMQLMPFFSQAEALGPEFYAALIPYSPFPTKLSQEMVQMLLKVANQPPPQPNPMQQAEVADKMASAQEKGAQAQHHTAQANVLNAEAGTKPGSQVASARLDLARTAEVEQRLVAAAQTPPLPTEIE